MKHHLEGERKREEGLEEAEVAEVAEEEEDRENRKIFLFI